MLKYNESTNDMKTRRKHPQNINGGRSKSQMLKYLSIYRRPIRNEDTIFKKTQGQIIGFK